MNILYLSNHLNIGGISSYLLTLGGGMKKKGHRVYLASGPGELAGSFKEAGIVCIAAPLKTKAEISLNVLVSFFKLLPRLGALDIDIIHANTRVTQVLAACLSRFSGRPFVSTAHGFFRKRMTRSIFPCWGRRVIAISRQVKDSLVHDFGVDQAAIRIIHNGISLEKFNPQYTASDRELNNRLGLKKGPVVGIVARLSEVKGHSCLIRAMRLVVDRFPAAQLVIAGEGKIKDSLMELSRHLEIDKNVSFAPNVLDTREVISLIDIFVLPSLEEGLGLSLMEAMSMGKAVIGSRVGGIKTLIRHEENGLLVGAQDIGQLAAAIMELLADAEKRKIFGDNAFKYIAENFSQDKMVSETERLYSECVGVKF